MTTDAAVVVFRIGRQGLTAPAPRSTPLADVVPLGIQDTADRAAGQALAVRRTDPRADDLAHAVDDGDLVPTFGPRGAATLVAPAALHRVGRSLLDESAADDTLPGLSCEIARKAVALVRDRGPLTKEELGEAVEDDVPGWAMQDCERCGRQHPSDQLVKTLAWTGRLRLEPASGAAGKVAPSARWRPARYTRARDEDRADAVRTYLRLHGPSTSGAFAEWAGIEPAWAQQCWSLVAEELADVPTEQQPRARLLAADTEALADPPDPPPARLVPPYDPLLQLRDRATLVPDAAQRRQVWRAVANPGVVLVGGRVVGTWRARRRGERLAVQVAPFGRLPGRTRSALEQDLPAVAAGARCTATEMAVD